MKIAASWWSLFGGCLLLACSTLATGGEPNSGGEPVQLRVLSYNIHHGEGVDGEVDLPRIAEVIKSVEPDLVALQEVDRGVERTDRVDQPARLARLTGLKVVFGNNIRYQGGDYGNAVLSRLPVERHKNHRLPSFYDGEQRGVLEVEIKLPDSNHGVVFFATHLDYRPDDAERIASAQSINDLVERNPDQPALLAGDLNAPPESETLRRFQRMWTRAGEEVLATFPSEAPVRQIDFILFRPAERWKTADVRVLKEPVASDHRPIFAVLELLPATAKEN